MDPLELLEKYAPVLQLREMSFDEKVGYMVGREFGQHTPDKLTKCTAYIRSILLGNQSRLLKQAAARQIPAPRPPAAKPVTSRADVEAEIRVIEGKLKNIDFADEHAGDNLARYGKRLATLKDKLAGMEAAK